MAGRAEDYVREEEARADAPPPATLEGGSGAGPGGGRPMESAGFLKSLTDGQPSDPRSCPTSDAAAAPTVRVAADTHGMAAKRKTAGPSQDELSGLVGSGAPTAAIVEECGGEVTAAEVRNLRVARATTRADRYVSTEPLHVGIGDWRRPIDFDENIS